MFLPHINAKYALDGISHFREGIKACKGADEHLFILPWRESRAVKTLGKVIVYGGLSEVVSNDRTSQLEIIGIGKWMPYVLSGIE